jgi:hypothetical protein
MRLCKAAAATLTAAVTTLALSAGAANAANLSLSGLISDPIANPGSFVATLHSDVADPTAQLDFLLTGFLSLDGHNGYQDVFSLTINGTQTFTGSFNLGGGGWSDTTFGSGNAVTHNQHGVDPGQEIGWHGGTTTVTGLGFKLLQGIDTFAFGYSALGAPAGQGLQDEGWGIASASVSAVPEPQTYVLLLAGLGMVGAIARRRQLKR